MLQKFPTFKSSFDDDKNKTNHCNLKLICKILCKIEKFQCITFERSISFKLLARKTVSLGLISEVAKKVLGVPASSSAVERMFSIAGHIYSVKRRRMKPKIFEQLVFCKLNEHLL